MIAYGRLLFRFLLLFRGSLRRCAAIRLILNNWGLQFSNILTDHFSSLGFLSITCFGIRTKDGIVLLTRDSAGHGGKTRSRSLRYLCRSKYGRGSTDSSAKENSTHGNGEL